jgi:hypothetical protein
LTQDLIIKSYQESFSAASVLSYASEVIPMLIKAPEAAKMLDIRLARLYELTRQRIVPSVRVGPKQLRYDPDTLREWIEKGGLQEQSDQRATRT